MRIACQTETEGTWKPFCTHQEIAISPLQWVWGVESHITWGSGQFTYTQPVLGLIWKYSSWCSNIEYVTAAFTPWSLSWAATRRKLIPTGVSSLRKSLKRQRYCQQVCSVLSGCFCKEIPLLKYQQCHQPFSFPFSLPWLSCRWCRFTDIVLPALPPHGGAGKTHSSSHALCFRSQPSLLGSADDKSSWHQRGFCVNWSNLEYEWCWQRCQWWEALGNYKA